MTAAKAGKLPGRTVHQGGAVATGEHALLWWLANEAAKYIVGDTPAERLSRGHKVAEVAAEKQLVKAMQSKASSSDRGPPLVVQGTIPKYNFKINVVKKKRGDGLVRTSVEISGTDFLADLTVPASTVQGDVLFDQVIAPGAFANTRLQQFSYLFDKYIFEDVKFHYSPVCAATTDGAIIAFPDYDPDDDLSVHSSDNVRKAAAHQGNKTVQLWEPKTWDFHKIRQRGADTLLFTDPASTDDRLTQQGRFTIVAADDIAQGSSYGLISMTYVCHFFITQIDNNPPLIAIGYKGDGNAAFTAASCFGPSVTAEEGSNVSISYSLNGSNQSVFELPSGPSTHKFLVVLQMVGTGLGTLSAAVYSAPDTLSTVFATATAATTQTKMYEFQYGGTAVLHALVLYYDSVTTISSATIWIFPIPEDFSKKRLKFVIRDEVMEMKEQMKLLQYKLGINLDLSDQENLEDEQDFQNLPLPAREAAKQLLAMKRTQSPTRK